MGSLIYVRLIGFTAGTLLQLFWMVVILGYRRQRNFERVFFFLCLSLFFFYSGSLLALNTQIYYTVPPATLAAFAKALLCAGLCFLPPLLVHLHLEYADARGQLNQRLMKWFLLLPAYAPTLYFALKVYPLAAKSTGFDFLLPGNALGRGYGIWLAGAALLCAAGEGRFSRTAADKLQLRFHGMLAVVFAVAGAMSVYLYVLRGPRSSNLSEWLSTALGLLAILPSAVLVYLVLMQRFDFLQFGRQKNLVYAVSATFLALLYLSLVHRLGVWLAPVLPPEATAAILLFVLVIFFEPLQMFLGRRLRETAHQEMGRLQRLMAEIQQEARQGNLASLFHFIEQRAKSEFDLASVELKVVTQADDGLVPGAVAQKSEQRAELSESVFVGQHAEKPIVVLRAEPHGAAISGETRAALEFLREQLPAAIDLCRLIEEKLRLERELAERERLALVGQMAASISHNLKNPLGSIKTILQVQLENPVLPDAVRGETEIVLEEIGRLSAKLNQLLQFSRPAVRGGRSQTTCDARAVIEEVAGVLRHEAERRGIALEVQPAQGGARTAAASEAVSDIVANLMANALEAAPRGGRVRVAMMPQNGCCVLTVEDNGPGIASDLREKILQPFFTTKTQGTGLGLAIVARRVAECGGNLDWDSPIADARGTRFRVSLPLEGARGQQP